MVLLLIMDGVNAPLYMIFSWKIYMIFSWKKLFRQEVIFAIFLYKGVSKPDYWKQCLHLLNLFIVCGFSLPVFVLKVRGMERMGSWRITCINFWLVWSNDCNLASSCISSVHANSPINVEARSGLWNVWPPKVQFGETAEWLTFVGWLWDI